MIILSGPEPQQGILEEKLKPRVQRFKGNVVLLKSGAGSSSQGTN
jgi:hypothetical protein